MSKKYKQIKVNLDENLYKKISVYAEMKEVSLAEVFRQSVGAKIQDIRKPKIKRVHKVTDPKLLYHLNKIGNNLNQISQHLNSGKNLDNQILIQLVGIEESLKRLL